MVHAPVRIGLGREQISNQSMLFLFPSHLRSKNCMCAALLSRNMDGLWAAPRSSQNFPVLVGLFWSGRASDLAAFLANLAWLAGSFAFQIRLSLCCFGVIKVYSAIEFRFVCCTSNLALPQHMSYAKSRGIHESSLIFYLQFILPHILAKSIALQILGTKKMPPPFLTGAIGQATCLWPASAKASARLS